MLISDEEFLEKLKKKNIPFRDIYKSCHELIPGMTVKSIPMPIHLERVTKERYFLCFDQDDDLAITLIPISTAENHPLAFIDAFKFLNRISH